jgi:CRISPR-associated protein Cmr3
MHCPNPEKYAGRGMGSDCPKCGDGPCAAQQLVGRAGEPAPFEIGPPLLAKMCNGSLKLFYPCPHDLALEDQGEHISPVVRILAPLELPAGVSSSLGGLRPVGFIAARRLSSFNANYLETAALSTYLDLRIPEEPVVAPEVYSEPRIGVGIDPGTRSAAESQLYIRDIVRLDDGAGLAIQVGRDFQLAGEIGRLGGDGRMVSMNSIEAPPMPRLPRGLRNRFKVYLASPACFERGWLPCFIDPESLSGQHKASGAHLKLVAAVIKESRPIGGWDLKAQQPRQMRRFVAAGSIYYFEVLSGDGDEVAELIHGKSFCDDHAMSMAGFGLAFVGRY